MLRFVFQKSILRPLVLAVLGILPIEAWAVDYHVKAAQDFQNALTLAAASSVSNNIYLTNGYYLGNFNYNSTNVNSLTIRAESGVTNTLITVDGGGTGSSLNISASGSPFVTVQGLTFLRNCGSTILGALQVVGGNTTIFLNGCAFLSPSNSSGIGLNILSGTNVTVNNCSAIGSATAGGGTGINISSILNNVTIQNCIIATNGVTSGNGIYVNNIGSIVVQGNLLIGNSGNYFSGTSVLLSSNTITANLPYSGAFCEGTTITLYGNNFNNNSVGWPGSSGGGAHCSGSTITVTGNSFISNSALNTSGWYSETAGGGAYCSGTMITVSSNVFIDNIASSISTCCGNNAYGAGGGIYCIGYTLLSNNIFIGNLVGDPPSGSTPIGNGGGAYCTSTDTNSTIISGNTFQQNSASLGGGLYVSGPAITIVDNLAVMNTATNTTSKGGGIWVNPTSTLNMVNNTIYGNSSLGTGGGVAVIIAGTSELLNVYNNIIWGNTATVSGGDVWLSGTGQKKIFSNNDADNLYGVWDLAQNNIDLSPKFFDPVNGDFHIQTTSPCRSVGTITAPSLPSTDLEGNPRMVNGLVDIGCYQFTTTVPHPADTNKDFVISAAEFNAYSAAWKSGQSWVTGPSPILAEYLTRAGYLMTNGGTYHNDGSARPVNWKIGH